MCLEKQPREETAKMSQLGTDSDVCFWVFFGGGLPNALSTVPFPCFTHKNWYATDMPTHTRTDMPTQVYNLGRGSL